MKGKFIKKLVAYALTAAMVVSTPMTAFASEFADNFWVSDGNEENDPSNSGTGTVTSTYTGTSVLKDNAENIKGIKVTPSAAVLNDTNDYKLELKAEIVYEKEPDADAKKKIEKHIEWSSSDLSIVRPAARATDRTICPIKGYNGGFATITASIDTNFDGEADQMAVVKVMVKKPVTNIGWKWNNGDKLYAGHTYDLHDYINISPVGAYDDSITFTMSGLGSKDKKLATLNGDGVLTLAKSIKEAKEVTLSVQWGNGNKSDVSVFLDAGNPVKSLKITQTKDALKYDFANNYKKVADKWTKEKQAPKDLTATVTAQKQGATTDELEWTSSNPRVVKVIETDEANKVKFEGVSVGKATVTVKSTSGKSAKANITVVATLKAISKASVKENKTYTGKSTQIILETIPEEATQSEKFKVTVGDKSTKVKGIKGKAGFTPIVIPGNDITKLSVGSATGTVENGLAIPANAIKISGKDKNIAACGVEAFTVYQSNVKVEHIRLAKVVNSRYIEKTTERLNPDRTVQYMADATGTPMDAISWETSKEAVAKVDDTGKVQVVGEGSAKITVSSVYTDTTGSKPKIKQAKLSFTVKSTPKCEEIVFKADTVGVAKGKKAVIQIKQQLPKKAADPIAWYIVNDDGTLKAMPQNKKAGIDDKKFTLETGSYPEGSVITVVAKAQTSSNISPVQAKATIVVGPTAKPAKPTLSWKGDAPTTIGSVGQLVISDKKDPVVRFEVDKKGANVVKVANTGVRVETVDGQLKVVTGFLKDSEGRSYANVVAISDGKATITAVTASGNKVKMVLEVSASSNSGSGK